MCANLHGWSDQDKVQYLIVSLKGNAQKMLGLLSPMEMTSFQLLCDRLAQRFGFLNKTELLVTQLHTKRKSDKESYQDLADDVTRMVSQVYPGMPCEQLDQVALLHFINAINVPELKLKLQLERFPRGITEAVLFCLKYDSVYGTKKEKVRHVSKSDQKTEKKHNQRRHTKDGRQIKCYFCHGDHVILKCPKFVPLPEPSTTSDSSASPQDF